MANSEYNSFKKLEAEETEKFPHAPFEVEQQLMGTVRTTKAAGNIVELYLSKMMDMIVALFGGNTVKHQSRENGESDQDSDFSPEGNSKNI